MRGKEGMNTLMIAGILLLLFWFVREYMLVFVNENTALLLVDARGRIRKLKPGIGFMMPWFLERPVENPKGGVVALRAVPVTFTGVYEAKDKSTIKVSTSFLIKPVFEYLEDYIKIDDKKRVDAAVERVRSIMSILIHEYPDRDAVMMKLEEIGVKIDKKFSSAVGDSAGSNIDLEKYFGISANQFVIGDAELPPELIAAQTKLEAQKKENQTRKLEMDNIREMVKQTVEDSAGSASPVSHKEAMDAVLVVQEKATKEIKVIDLGPGAQSVAGGVISGLAMLGNNALELAEKFADKKKKEEGGEDGAKE